VKILGLDISKHLGFAVIKDGKLIDSGSVDVDARPLEPIFPEIGYIMEAEELAGLVHQWVVQHNSDYIYIEQTNKGKNRTSQKELEFLHYGIIKHLLTAGFAHKVRYVDSSTWRKTLVPKMTKEQKNHNKKARSTKGHKKKGEGKITPKHLAVWWVNSTFGKNLLLVENDEADAIAIATYGYKHETKLLTIQPVIVDLEKQFKLT
jgi:hypothetical protein